MSSYRNKMFTTTTYDIIDPFFSYDMQQCDHLTTTFLTTPPTPLSLLTFPSFTTDLIQIEQHSTTKTIPFTSSYKKITTRRVDPTESSCLLALCDRVSSLESKFDKLLEVKTKEKERCPDRKYTWTAEIKGGKGEKERKYKWTAEIEGEKKKEHDNKKKVSGGERKYQWTAEIKGEGDEKKTYTWKASIGGDKDKKKKDEKKEKKKEKKGSCGYGGSRLIEIEEPSHHGALVLRQAFAKRALAAKNKGKHKELSAEDAAAIIQMTFKAYLIRRSQTLRALRELAIAKTKLKELRALFHNFSYRSRIARDAEERQKFSEKIIVLLLTVDSIEGIDLMVRTAKRSMVDELEAILEVVDPQPTGGRSLSMRRRTFDMPSAEIQKELAEGVAQVVQMLDQEEGAFEACL